MAKRDIERALRKKGITAESIQWVSTPTPGENVMTWEIVLADTDADTFGADAWNFFDNTAEALEWVNELKPCAACRICGCTAQPASPAGVPDGWVLVPREPTPGMIGACVAVWQERIRLKSESGTLLCGGNAEQSFRENWSAMIGAAPQTRAAEGEVKAADFATAMRSCGLSLKTYAEVDREARRIAEERAAPSAPPMEASDE